ncbi:MAG: hypothetical protein A2Y10_15295 [Planctomycetes bacterium GWF2_41_51]|nr:MAG: hypothetical protein A2Y10_15295 [Planctomycetes bacterium GWF2_41_51]HBG26966.1 hypothetical protein [Phycisphaerales bacterium]
MTSKKAFTLVELLVVISIIALLLSVLMPALSKARQSARKTVCASQQKQIVTASLLWAAEDSRGALPRGGVHDSVGNDTDIAEWLGLRDFLKMATYMFPKLKVPDDPLKYPGPTSAQMKKSLTEISDGSMGRVFVCPEFATGVKGTTTDTLLMRKTSINKVYYGHAAGEYVATIGYNFLAGFNTSKWEWDQLGGVSKYGASPWKSAMKTTDPGYAMICSDRLRYVPRTGSGWATSTYLVIPHTSRGFYQKIGFPSEFDPKQVPGACNVFGTLDGSVQIELLTKLKLRQTLYVTSSRGFPHEDYSFF